MERTHIPPDQDTSTRNSTLTGDVMIGCNGILRLHRRLTPRVPRPCRFPSCHRGEQTSLCMCRRELCRKGEKSIQGYRMGDKATRVYRVSAHRNIRFQSLLNFSLYLDIQSRQPLTKDQLSLKLKKKKLCKYRVEVQSSPPQKLKLSFSETHTELKEADRN